MKVKNMLEFIKLPEGVTAESLGLDKLEAEWNRQYNGMKVSLTNEVTEKVTGETTKALLDKYGLEKEEDIKSLVDSTKNKEQLENEKLVELQTKFESLESTLKEKDAELVNSTRLSFLRDYKTETGQSLNPERLSKAHKLILSDVSDEKDYESVVKEFVSSTPEWLQGTQQKPGVNLGTDNLGADDTKDQEVTDLTDSW